MDVFDERRHRPLKVVLVDDDEVQLEWLAFFVGALGHVPLLAADVGAAFGLVQREDAGLVITDLEMPVLDGFDLLRLLRDGGHRVPVVALSGTADRDILDRAAACGFAQLLSKPSCAERLTEVLALASPPTLAPPTTRP